MRTPHLIAYDVNVRSHLNVQVVQESTATTVGYPRLPRMLDAVTFIPFYRLRL